jgi:hypothetical protein
LAKIRVTLKAHLPSLILALQELSYWLPTEIISKYCCLDFRLSQDIPDLQMPPLIEQDLISLQIARFDIMGLKDSACIDKRI